MTVLYEKNKENIYRYMKNNREKWNVYQNDYRKEHNVDERFFKASLV